MRTWADLPRHKWHFVPLQARRQADDNPRVRGLGAKRACRSLDRRASHGYEDLARNAIVVITDKDEVSSRVDKDAIEEHLAGICRELIAVPHDRGVADGDLVTLDVLKPETRRAYKEIAAAIVDGYR